MLKVYTIDTTGIRNGSYTGASTITAGSTASGTITANNGYVAPRLSSDINFANVTGQYTRTSETVGTITLSNPIDSANNTVYIETECPQKYNITVNVTNGYSSAISATYIISGGTAMVIVVPNAGYKLPVRTAVITVTNATADFSEYTTNNGKINLSNPTDDVTISLTCLPA